MVSPYSTTLPVTDGNHILWVFANDSSGNWASRSYTFITDDTPPSVSVTGIYNQTKVNRTLNIVTVAVDVNDITIVELLVDNEVISSKEYAPYTFPWDTTIVPDGEHNVTIRVTDEAGNVQVEKYAIVVDNSVVGGNVEGGLDIAQLGLIVVSIGRDCIDCNSCSNRVWIFEEEGWITNRGPTRMAQSSKSITLAGGINYFVAFLLLFVLFFRCNITSY